MSSNQKIIDSLTLRQIFIERYSKGEAKRLLKHLTRLSKQLKEVLSKDYDRITTVRLIRRVDRLAEKLLKDYGADLTKGLKDYALDEAEFAGQAMVAATTATAVNPPVIKSIEAALTKSKMKLITNGKVQSLTIPQAVERFSKKQKTAILRAIRDGVTIGRTSREVVDDIDELLTGRTRHQAASLVRTATNHAGNQARAKTYKENTDVIIGEEYTATLDSRTTIECASLDGNHYHVGEGPLPPIHWGCRSVRVPLINPEYNLGANVKGQRSSEDGPVSAQTTYGGWLKRQNHDKQDEVLGKERATLFRSGKLSIGSFTDDTGKVYTLAQLKRLNPLAFE